MADRAGAEEAPYWVWRRSDGYVGCTKGRRPPSNSRDTFDVLLTTQDWPEAWALIEKERADA